MVDPNQFYDFLVKEGIGMFAGVPDSLLKQACACITDRSEPGVHTIAANEGAAVGLAVGHHLATGKPGLVYLQNSGLGNIVNPVLSIADPKVYSIPMVLLIGWRGEPEVKDEPQHLKQGEITLALLETMGIPYLVLEPDFDQSQEALRTLIQDAKRMNGPVAIIVKKGTFANYRQDDPAKEEAQTLLSREEVLGIILQEAPSSASIVSTTGMPSREIFEHREHQNQGHEKDFLTVGAMGHCSQIALGIALAHPEKKVACIDGDGALLMHMGSLAIIGQSNRCHFHHILINNGKHDSVGGQPTVGFDINFPAIAQACGYKSASVSETEEEIRKALQTLFTTDGPNFLEVRVKGGARPDLGRPTTTPIENKEAFMSYLQTSE